MIDLPGKAHWVLWPVPGLPDQKDKEYNYRYVRPPMYEERWGESRPITSAGSMVTSTKGRENAL